jgi:arabinose-5-phosphate isomerase
MIAQGPDAVTSLDDAERILQEARRVFHVEARGVERIAEHLGPQFVQAIDLLVGCTGRVIVSGIGKSGIIGRKIAATLTSTGTPANFLHPVEGLHGDLGIVGPNDVAVLISNSGETSELAGLVDYFVRTGVPIIALTGDCESPLAAVAAVTLDCSVDEEACPMDLAPTTSTTAALAMGDALAVVLLQQKGFKEADFALLHPGGSLGRKLTLCVEDIMISEGYPQLEGAASMRDCIVPLSEQRGTVPIVDAEQRLLGVVTAGDLTRLMEHREDFLDCSVTEVMTTAPKVAHASELASAALHRMETYGIMALPVVGDDAGLVGIVHLHDLMKAKML